MVSWVRERKKAATGRAGVAEAVAGGLRAGGVLEGIIARRGSRPTIRDSHNPEQAREVA